MGRFGLLLRCLLVVPLGLVDVFDVLPLGVGFFV